MGAPQLVNRRRLYCKGLNDIPDIDVFDSRARGHCLEQVPSISPLTVKIRGKELDAFSECALICSTSSADEFHEELLLRPLPSGHLHAHFQFVTTWHVSVHNDQVE